MYFYWPKSTTFLLFSQFLTRLLISYLPLVVGALPLLSAAVVGLAHKQRPRYWLTTLLLALAMLLGGYLLALTYHGATWHGACTWLCIPVPLTPRCWVLSFYVDFAVAIMVSLTTTVSFVTHLYALAYMQTARKRYFVYTGCFVSAMLGFYMAESLVARFIGWELIGWGSYLLISFWHQQEAAARSGTKAWLINQLGSMTLLTGILIIGSELGSFNLSTLAALPKDAYHDNSWLTVAKYCLVGGALSKSAQFPWFSWLSSAMTAPAPASALIHTATMVGSGVYLLINLAPLLGIEILTYVAYWGSLTAFMGAYVALTQQHIKQVLAYSTISQLGYTVMAVGIGASSVGLFHFMTHAFGKACLFLCVGTISRFLSQQQGEVNAMQYMGGLRKQLPITFCAYLIASFSLVGIPGLAGSLSKEAVLACTWAWAGHQAQHGYYLGYLVPMLSFCTAFLGGVYMGRQCYLVFMGTPRWSHKLALNVPYRTSWLIQISMVILALCSLDFWYGLTGGIENSGLLQRLGRSPLWTFTLPITSLLQHNVTAASVITMFLGLLFLVIWQAQSPATLLLPCTKLSLHEGYWDILANAIVWGVLNLSRLIAEFDYLVVNGLVYRVGASYVKLSSMVRWLDRKLLSGVILLVASMPRHLGKAHQITQKGNLQHSLLWMFISIGFLFWGIYWATRGIQCNR